MVQNTASVVIARNQEALVESMCVGGSPVVGPGRGVAYHIFGHPTSAMLRARRQEAANRPKPRDPISDPILDPDGFGRCCPHHSILRNRIQKSIPKSDLKLDPSISSFGSQNRTPHLTPNGAFDACS